MDRTTRINDLVNRKLATKNNAIDWLEKNLQTDTALGPEVLRVSLSGENPEEVAQLLNAVIESYLQDLVYKEHTKQVTRLEPPLDVKDGLARLDNIRGTLLGGEVTGKFQVSLDATPRYAASVALRGADLQHYTKTLYGRQTFRGAVHAFPLPPALVSALDALGRREEATPSMTFLAGFLALLHRYSGQDDLLVGTPVANRPRPELEKVVGFFVNVVVLRTEVAGDAGFRELLRRVRQGTLEAQAHQHLPFDVLVQELRPERSAAGEHVRLRQAEHAPPGRVRACANPHQKNLKLFPRNQIHHQP